MKRSVLNGSERTDRCITAAVFQTQLDYLGNDLELPKLKTGLLMSRLQQWNFFDDDMKAPAFPFRQRGLFRNV